MHPPQGKQRSELPGSKQSFEPTCFLPTGSAAEPAAGSKLVPPAVASMRGAASTSSAMKPPSSRPTRKSSFTSTCPHAPGAPPLPLLVPGAALSSALGAPRLAFWEVFLGLCLTAPSRGAPSGAASTGMPGVDKPRGGGCRTTM